MTNICLIVFKLHRVLKLGQFLVERNDIFNEIKYKKKKQV